jgi:serine O-acetyltransferase
MTAEHRRGDPDPWSDLRRDLGVDLERCGPRPFLREWSAYALLVYRLGRWNDDRRGPLKGLFESCYWVAHRLVIAVSNIEIPKEARIGGGLRVHHSGPVVVHPASVLGAGCTLRQGVTIGERRAGSGVPMLGDRVDVGAYAQILGPITVGDDARIGALALVVDDVPAGGVAVAPRADVRASTDPAAG